MIKYLFFCITDNYSKATFLIVFFFIFSSIEVRAQETPVHISSTDVYNFIDELANEKLFSLNSCIKPFSRKDIIELLILADSQRFHLSARQNEELEGYLYEFTGKNRKKDIKEKPQLRLLPPELKYHDKNSSFIIRPIYEFNGSTYKDGPSFYQTSGGAEIIFHKSIISAFANLTDHYINNEILVKPSYLITGLGGNYKINEGDREGGDFSEMRGGIMLNWNWGRIGILKDHVQWSDNNFGGLIFSGQTPSFPMLTLNIRPFKWFALDYLHGWLVSEVIDSNSSYYSSPGVYRGVYQPKYIAANMFTFRPWKYFNISIGNSIIYSDMPVQVVYLIPVLFYKSVDHTINHGIDNQNSQIFLNVSSRNVRHLHLYGSLFIDEFSIERITDYDRYNFLGFKLGSTLSNWPIKDIALDLESTIIYPMVYKHRISTLTFASNQYNLGYRMGDNSMDFHFRVRVMPFRFLFSEVQYQYAVHGNNYEYILNKDIDRHPLISKKVWDRNLVSISINYIPVIGLKVYIEGMFNEINGYDADGLLSSDYLKLFSPEVYIEGNWFFNFGLKLGL